MKVVAIIPAKADSKRLPRKNLITMLGKPLPVWAIEAAKASQKIDRVIVSTQDEEIAQMAREAGAEVPYMEPLEISAGGGDIEGLLLYAVEWLRKNEGYVPDAVVLLQTTSPLRLPDHLDAAIAQFEQSGADSTITVCKALGNHNPHWMLVEDQERGASLFTGGSLKDIPRRSDHLPVSYFRNDIAYVLKPSNLYQTPCNLYGDKVDLYKMDEIFDGDINTQEDWNIAEDKLRRLRSSL
ncbi:MAG: acylneuraminate cytidylyltransferase family protein [Candidatus Paceibacterota bacterium]